uniref:Uncharacterized protein n=1 Tax=Cucumis melo TaxID=3656 RepID=A0A9I9CKB1_CUCME
MVNQRLEVDGEDEEEKEEDDVPLKCKQQGEEEALGSKRLKSSKANDSEEILSHASTKSPKKKKPANLPLPNKSKSFKATNSQTLTCPKCLRLSKIQIVSLILRNQGKKLIKILPLLYIPRKEPTPRNKGKILYPF